MLERGEEEAEETLCPGKWETRRELDGPRCDDQPHNRIGYWRGIPAHTLYRRAMKGKGDGRGNDSGNP